MVEAGRKRSRLLSFAKFLSPPKTRKPLPNSPIHAAVEWLPTAKEDQITTGSNGVEVGQSLDDPSRTLAAGSKVSPDTICPVCLNLFQEDLNEEDRDDDGFDEPTGHLMPTWHVYRAATQGCSGCEIIAWVLEPYTMQLDGSRKKVRIFFDKWHYPKSGVPVFFKLEFYLGFEPVNAVHAEITIRSTLSESGKASPCPWLYAKSIATMPGDTGSSTAIKNVKAWYSQCLLNHEQCRRDQSSKLPTRIICIDGSNIARLHTPEDEQAEYVCLSHCWGGQTLIQTTIETLEQYTVDLPWEQLPKTFQDAIQFTHGLGFKYLWIDSLCIIQDSVDDWRHEGSRMSQIYANACMTLSATWATNPSQGCFVTPDKRYVSRMRSFTNIDQEPYELHCHELLPRLDNPLQRRGWVFQERMLSRRIVHFMEQELWWECRTSFLCQCGNHNNRNLGIGMDWTAKLAGLSSSEDILSYWEYIVQIYTMKSLTYPSDIFPALQGLAKLFPPIMGRYLAGHWENSLVHSLCWYPKQPAALTPNQWRAPSWSWAAAHGPVKWPRYAERGRHFVTVLGATTTPKGDDTMGQISYGAIVLRGKCLTGYLETKGHGSSALHFLWLRETESGFPSDWYLFSADYDGTSHLEDETPLVALGISDSHGYGKSEKGCWLILRPTETEAGEFVRIGIKYEDADPKGKSPKSRFKARYDKEAVEMDIKII